MKRWWQVLLSVFALALPTSAAAVAYVVGTYNGAVSLGGIATLLPVGTGAGEGGVFILRELAVNGTNTISLRAPDALAADVTYTLPASTTEIGQRVATDGAGVWTIRDHPVVVVAAYPNAQLVTNTTYGKFKVGLLGAGSTNAIARAVTGYVVTAGTGAGSVTFEPGASCSCTLSCTTSSGTAARAACTGSCNFAPNTTVVLKTKNAAECTSYPTVSNLALEVNLK